MKDNSRPVRLGNNVSSSGHCELNKVLSWGTQGGKGRTGVFISAFLLWSGHRRTALDALELFTFRRSENYKPEVCKGSMSHIASQSEKMMQSLAGVTRLPLGGSARGNTGMDGSGKWPGPAYYFC